MSKNPYVNPYLAARRDQYNALVDTMTGLQTRAVEEGRDLSDDELRSIKEQGEQAKTLAEEIESLTEIETRNRKVAELAAVTAEPTKSEPQKLGTSGTTAVDRDPGHYVRHGGNSFFSDMYRARTFDDNEAKTRLTEHQRALTTGTHGVGVVPPKWLTNEFELLARQGRAVASSVRNIPLGDDPRPLTLPKQTAGTSVAPQAGENDVIPESSSWDSDVDTVSPKPTAGKQTVSRQMIDMSSPAIDQLIYGDMIAVYNTAVELQVVTAILAAGPTALSASPRSGPNTAADPAFEDQLLEAAIKVRTARIQPANVAVMSIRRYGEFLKLKDADGRPLIGGQSGQSVNVIGVGTVPVDGMIHGLGIIASNAVTDAGDDSDTFAAIYTPDTILFESNMLRFRFEEQAGPESVVLGIWGYTATIVRQGGKGVQRVTVDPTTV